MSMRRVPRDFYKRSTRVVAIELLGKVLVVCHTKKTLRVRIVETEAYFGENDPASHAYRGMTPRNRVMFGPPGFMYVYFIYGNHYCLNIVTENEGTPGAVLIRAVEPLVGIRDMMKRRRVKDIHHITNGPGKLTQALGITKQHSGLDVLRSDISIIGDTDFDKHNLLIGVTPRIGIHKGKNKLYRFYIKHNKFVSPAKV